MMTLQYFGMYSTRQMQKEKTDRIELEMIKSECQGTKNGRRKLKLFLP
jgi:hypothetical protein